MRMTHIASILKESPVHAKVLAHVPKTGCEGSWVQSWVKSTVSVVSVVMVCVKEVVSKVFSVQKTCYRDCKNYAQHSCISCKKLLSL